MKKLAGGGVGVLSGIRKSRRGPTDKNPKWKCWVAVVIAFVGLTVVVEAQQPKKVPRIGYLSNSDAATDSTRAEGIRLALRERGYIEGQSIAIEYRYTEGKFARASELAAELVGLKVDIIVLSGGDALIRAAKNATKTIPIVMVGAGVDPVGAGFIENLARPGGNVTGLTLLTSELGGKRLELLKEAVPKVAGVAVLYEPGDRNNELELKEIQTAAGALKLTIQPWEVRAADDFRDGLCRVKQAALGWILCARGRANEC